MQAITQEQYDKLTFGMFTEYKKSKMISIKPRKVKEIIKFINGRRDCSEENTLKENYDIIKLTKEYLDL